MKIKMNKIIIKSYHDNLNSRSIIIITWDEKIMSVCQMLKVDMYKKIKLINQTLSVYEKFLWRKNDIIW